MSILGLGNPRGSGFRVGRGQMGKWGKCKGQFTINPRKKRTDPVTARRVPSKWKGEQGEQGEHGSKGIIVYIACLSYVYNGTSAVVNDTSCTLHNNNNRNECC
jgi:hypothetical protein